MASLPARPTATELDPAFQLLLEKGIERRDDAWVYADLEGLSRGDFPDATGFEAVANKLHLGDVAVLSPDELLRQAVTFAEELAVRLREFPEPCRVFLSEQEPGEVQVRFWILREGEAWAPEPETIEHEAVAVWDSR